MKEHMEGLEFRHCELPACCLHSNLCGLDLCGPDALPGNKVDFGWFQCHDEYYIKGGRHYRNTCEEFQMWIDNRHENVGPVPPFAGRGY